MNYILNDQYGLGRILSQHRNSVCGSVWYRVQFRYGIHSVAASRCQAVTA